MPPQEKPHTAAQRKKRAHRSQTWINRLEMRVKKLSSYWGKWRCCSDGRQVHGRAVELRHTLMQLPMESLAVADPVSPTTVIE